jgi:hypothetical protein
VPSFRDVYPSVRLPHSDIFGRRPATVIINVDQSTEGGSHWPAIHVEPRSCTCFYFDSYGLAPIIPSIQTFLRRTCSVWDYNRTQLQVLTTIVCGHYCTFFALYMDRGFTPKQFLGLRRTSRRPAGTEALRIRIRTSGRWQQGESMLFRPVCIKRCVAIFGIICSNCRAEWR